MGDAVGKAGRVLFGPAFVPPGDPAAEDWRRRVREAWRRQALESHPDRAAALGRDEEELAGEFQALSEAYRVLCPSQPAAPRAPAPPSPARPPRPPVDHVHRGTLPRRRLLFAEYLYYSGRVSWRNLVEAVAWQRRQRPPIGRLAVACGQLSEAQVREVLAARRRGRDPAPFGEWARDLGLLTRGQLLALLGRQRRQQRRIGEFFIEAGLLDAGEIPALELRLAGHNARFRRQG